MITKFDVFEQALPRASSVKQLKKLRKKDIGDKSNTKKVKNTMKTSNPLDSHIQTNENKLFSFEQFNFKPDQKILDERESKKRDMIKINDNKGIFNSSEVESLSSKGFIIKTDKSDYINMSLGSFSSYLEEKSQFAESTYKNYRILILKTRPIQHTFISYEYVIIKYSNRLTMGNSVIDEKSTDTRRLRGLDEAYHKIYFSLDDIGAFDKKVEVLDDPFGEDS